MSPKADELLAAVLALSEHDALNITYRLVDHFRIPLAPYDPVDPEPVEYFEVKLTGVLEGRRLDVIRAVRAEFKVGLADAKLVVEKAALGLAPALHDGRLSHWDAQYLANRMLIAGTSTVAIAYPTPT
ncbi:MAG: hypothetical protein ACRDV9_13415 [Acidimicrobiia bacterium]